MSARDEIAAHFTSDTLADSLLDAYRVEVLAADGQAYDGELAMLRGLVRTLRAVARYGTDMGEVQRLLTEHANDDAEARTEAVAS